MKRFFLILFLSVCIFSCDSESNQSERNNIETTLIHKDNLYGNGAEGIAEQNMVISDSTVWNSLIAQMNLVNTVSDNFSEVEIDFSAYKIIAVFDDIKANGGYSLELNITSSSEQILVNVTELEPQGNATTVMTQPYHIVKIPKSDLPIHFE